MPDVEPLKLIVPDALEKLAEPEKRTSSGNVAMTFPFAWPAILNAVVSVSLAPAATANVNVPGLVCSALIKVAVPPRKMALVVVTFNDGLVLSETSLNTPSSFCAEPFRICRMLVKSPSML